MHSGLRLVLARLEAMNLRPRRQGDGWIVFCPVHENPPDKHRPSLSVRLAEDSQKVLLRCFAGCSAEAILRALGLEWKDLQDGWQDWPPSQKPAKTSAVAPSESGNGDHHGDHQRSAGGPTGQRSYPSAAEALAAYGNRRGWGKPNHIWTYTLADGSPCFAVGRWNHPPGETGKQFAQVSRQAEGAWVLKNTLDRLPLYNLPEIVNADPDVPIVVCEGEKATEAARQCGLLATCSAGGANAAAKTDWSSLAGRKVIVLPDNDNPGQKYAETVARLALEAGAAEVKILRLADFCPGMPEGGDIADVLDSPDWCGCGLREGASAEDFKAWLLSKAEALAPFQPPKHTEAKGSQGDVLVSMLDNLIVEWTWRPQGAKQVVLARWKTSDRQGQWTDTVRLTYAKDRQDLVERFRNNLEQQGVDIPPAYAAAWTEKLDILAAQAAVESANRPSPSQPPSELPGRELRIEWPEPWEQSVQLADLLEETVQALERYMVMTPEQAWTVALWTAWTWVFDHFDVAPMLFVSSPTKRCGKSTLMKFLSIVTARPLLRTPSPAAVFRIVEEHRPTLLLDEADLLIKQSEEWRLLLNAGHYRQTAAVVRCTGDEYEPREFSTWCPKAIAAIGKLPSTLEDRSIIITLQRKASWQKTERLTLTDWQKLHPIAQRFMRWKLDVEARQPGPWPIPAVPPELNDRQADNWGPILAVAEMAGGDWPNKAREAACSVSEGREEDELSIQLLKDLWEVWEEEDFLSTSTLIDRLSRLEESPWGTLNRGRPITPRKLANMLSPFGVKSRHTKVGNGYYKKDLLDLWERYFLPTGVSNLHNLHRERNSLSDKDLSGEGLVCGEASHF